MSEHLEPETNTLDEQVAQFADILLSQGLPEMDFLVQDEKLSSYLDILTQLSRMAKVDAPNQEVVERVRSHLMEQWKTGGPDSASGVQEHVPVKPKAPSVYQSSRQRQNFTLRLAFAVIVVVVFAAFFMMPTINHAFPGAAGGQSDLLLFLVVIILFCGFAAWWFFHRNG